MKMVVAATLAALALGVIAPASAQGIQEIVVTGTKTVAPGTQVKSKTVNYADLNLKSSAGIKTLYTRIHAAAKDVCAPAPVANDMSGRKDYDQCVSHAVDTAVAQVGNPDLTAMVASAAH